jgi:hypothetical protein
MWVTRQLLVPISHEDAFHQTRSDGYHSAVRASQHPVSFHKFTNYEENDKTEYDQAEIERRYRADFKDS